jgi:hypothetical protein
VIYIDIKVIGSDCKNGMKLTKMLKKAADETKTDCSIVELNDTPSKKKYGIKSVPGLIINGEVISEGKVLTVREIYKILVNN